jgi:DNA-binding protein HU-beta
MTKTELIAAIADRTLMSKAAVALTLESLADVTAGQLATAKEISLPGIGKLATSTRPARTGRNPRTGESVAIAASTSVKFKVAKSLKDAVN